MKVVFCKDDFHIKVVFCKKDFHIYIYFNFEKNMWKIINEKGNKKLSFLRTTFMQKIVFHKDDLQLVHFSY